jgi:hypothetical protein
VLLSRLRHAALLSGIAMLALMDAPDAAMAQGMMADPIAPPYLYMPVDANTTQTDAEAFDNHDADGDGVLSQDEYDGATSQAFKQFDKNGDGVITPDEMPNTPRAQKTFQAMDKNGDGVVTQQEFQIHSAEWYQQHDLNKDGSLSKSEATGGQ